MRAKSLRALFMTLALVIQTIAGSSTAVHASTGPSPTAGDHCARARMVSQAHAPATPAGDLGHEHSCPSCLFCDHPNVALGPQFGVQAYARREARIVGVASEDRAIWSQPSIASSARGPPA